MKVIRAVCFDVDGVLLDSLSAHLKVCEDKSREYGLNLSIPGPAEFRELVRHHSKASPMNLMFETLGFSREQANRAFAEYTANFARDYQMPPFPGVEQMLSALADAGLRLGIVSANVRSNIEHGLGRNLRFFDPRCVLTKENAVDNSKVQSLRTAVGVFGIGPDECLYVGDQPADWQAAEAVGTRFLGVTYGWGISKEDREFPTVDEVAGIAVFVRQLNGAVLADR